MIRETGMQQQYCLRWNNHKTNLLTVFDELFRNEDFTDVTLVCEGGSFVKCHKMVLVASSSYFQGLFSELQCKNPIIVLKDVRSSEIQAILEYMYKGEVSITVEEVEPLLKIAEALKVKGLVGENNIRECSPGDEYNAISTSSTFGIPSNKSNSQTRQTSSPNDPNKNVCMNSPMNETGSNENVNNTSGGSKNENESSSPPHSTGIHPSFQKAPYLYGKSGNRLSLPIWPMTGLPINTPPTPHTAAVMLNCYEAAIAASNADMPPLRRKKLSNFNMNRDTPILRTVLGQGQGQVDSSQPISLVCHGDNPEQPQSNGPTTPQDGSYGRMKSETLSEDAHSPYMETSFMDEDISQDRGNKVMHSSSSSPQSFYSDSKGGVTSGIASYVPNQQKPEWKRYKQYTRNDIMSAIDAVRNGMSALQAARKYGVPSRTLYDKVKKLGITTSRPFRRSNGSNGAAFPYGISGTGGAMMFSLPNEDDQGQGPALDHGFLQHALESGGKVKFEGSEREALSVTPPAAPPHSSLLLQRALEVDERLKSEMIGDSEALSLTQGDNSGASSGSPPPNDRSPSPNMMKYVQHNRSLTPSPTLHQGRDDYEDQVEDLSMSRKPEQQPPQPPQPQQQSRVIMPPMNQAQATILASCSDNLRE